jgi:hypothetical protein
LRRPFRLDPPLIDVGVIPQLTGDLDWVDAACLPPSLLVTGAMDRAMMDAAERDREFIAGLTAERARLQVAQVMWVGGLTTADQARLLSDSAKVLPVAVAPRCGNGEGALVDAVGSVKVSARGRGRPLRIVIGNGQSLIARRVCPSCSELRQPAFKGLRRRTWHQHGKRK